MAKIYTGREDETIVLKIRDRGMRHEALPKWAVLRLALAYSLHLGSPPDSGLDTVHDRNGGSEYDIDRVTGSLTEPDGMTEDLDLSGATRALLSVFHGEDLFADDDRYRKLLQRHVRRGLREFRRGWREGHDFFEFVRQEMLSGLPLGRVLVSDRSEQLLDALNEIGVRCQIRDSVQGPRLTRFRVYLPEAEHFDVLKRGLEKLSFILGLKSQGVLMHGTAEPKVAALDVPRPRETWEAVPCTELRRWAAEEAPVEHLLPVWPGVGVLGEPVLFDLAEAPHVLVGGATGSGKSVCLHALILSLILRLPPEELRLSLFDPKQVELTAYKGLPHLAGQGVVTEAAAAATVLADIVDEMETRVSRLAEVGARDLAEARRKGKLTDPFMVVVVEELADLFAQSRTVEQPLVRLAQKGRAAGIHMVLATQRPDAETLSGQLRSNIPGRIGLTVQKSTESKIILDETGAERLTGRGDMLLKIAGSETRRVHGVHVLPDDVAAAVREAGRRS